MPEFIGSPDGTGRRAAVIVSRFNETITLFARGSNASGFSRMMIFSTTSGVIGSIYVRSAVPGSVMIVAGLEFTSTTS